MSSGVIIRAATAADGPAIQNIYAHHVLHGLASFEETPPDVAEIMRRHDAVTTAGLPYLVAELDGAVRGFAYAMKYRERSAYRYTVENSIYVAADAMGRGIGGGLLAALITRTADAGYRQMVAVIGDSGNAASIALHARHGFRVVGVLPAVGYKFDRWVDSVLMVLALGDGDTTPPVRAFTDR